MINTTGPIKRINVESVLMPMIRVMKSCDLSWANREEIASAIAATFQQWKNMEDERLTLNQQSCGQQQQPGNRV